MHKDYDEERFRSDYERIIAFLAEIGGEEISVREELLSYGVDVDAAHNRLDRMLAQQDGMKLRQKARQERLQEDDLVKRKPMKDRKRTLERIQELLVLAEERGGPKPSFAFRQLSRASDEALEDVLAKLENLFDSGSINNDG